MPAESLLDRASNYASKELERIGGDLLKLPVPLQTVVLIYPAQGMVDNGGFRYFFENDFPGNPPYSIFCDAYRRIGAVEAAECLERAVSMFPFDHPHLSAKRRSEFMDPLDESSEFFELGNRVCGDETVWARLEEYVTKHASSFPLT